MVSSRTKETELLARIAPYSWDSSQDRLMNKDEARKLFIAGKLWRVEEYSGMPTYCFPHKAAERKMSVSDVPGWFYLLKRVE